MHGGVDFNTGTVSYRPDQNKKQRIIPQGGEQGKTLNTLRDVGAMRAFLESVRTRKTPPSNVHDAREAAFTSMLVREAVHTGRPVTMKELLAKG